MHVNCKFIWALLVSFWFLYWSFVFLNWRVGFVFLSLGFLRWSFGFLYSDNFVFVVVFSEKEKGFDFPQNVFFPLVAMSPNVRHGASLVPPIFYHSITKMPAYFRLLEMTITLIFSSSNIYFMISINVQCSGQSKKWRQNVKNQPQKIRLNWQQVRWIQQHVHIMADWRILNLTYLIRNLLPLISRHPFKCNFRFKVILKVTTLDLGSFCSPNMLFVSLLCIDASQNYCWR